MRGDSRIAATTSSGPARMGMCPVVSSSVKVLAGISRCTYWPTSRGAIASSVHCRTSVGTVTAARSLRLSERNVTCAKWRAMSGSVRQKLAVSRSPNSGRSGLPIIIGAATADQPR